MVIFITFHSHYWFSSFLPIAENASKLCNDQYLSAMACWLVRCHTFSGQYGAMLQCTCAHTYGSLLIFLSCLNSSHSGHSTRKETVAPTMEQQSDWNAEERWSIRCDAGSCKVRIHSLSWYQLYLKLLYLKLIEIHLPKDTSQLRYRSIIFKLK